MRKDPWGLSGCSSNVAVDAHVHMGKMTDAGLDATPEFLVEMAGKFGISQAVGGCGDESRLPVGVGRWTSSTLGLTRGPG